MFFNPLSFLLIVLFFFSLLFFFVLLQINVIALAFAQMGIPSHYIFTALFASLLGSFINIPIKRIPQETMAAESHIRYFGIRYLMPVWKRKETVLAALLSVVLAYDYAPAIAYTCGTLGTLIGADILNLKKISHLGASVASIGGAGTFDGIFLNGILAVLLSAIIT